MYQSQIAMRYAKALFLLAKERNKLGEIKNDMLFVFDTINNSNELSYLLDHPVIKSTKKIEAIKKILQEHIDPISLSFVELIINNKREKYLKRITLDFIDIYKKNKGINSVVLTTAYELTEDEKQKVANAIEEKTKSTVELKTTIDESILGGLILQINDKELDMSVQKQLQRFKQNLFLIDLNNKNKKKH